MATIEINSYGEIKVIAHTPSTVDKRDFKEPDARLKEINKKANPDTNIDNKETKGEASTMKVDNKAKLIDVNIWSITAATKIECLNNSAPIENIGLTEEMITKVAKEGFIVKKINENKVAKLKGTGIEWVNYKEGFKPAD